MAISRKSITKKILNLLFVFTAVLILSGCATSTNCIKTTQADEPFFFIQISDPQLFWGPEVEWEKAVNHANCLKPPFVVVCGDLVHHTGDPAEINAYRDIAKKLDSNIKLYNVSGNHDVGNEPTIESVEAYKKIFGKIWYSFSYNGCLCIVIESNLINAPKNVEELAADQMKWLTKTLEDAESKNYNHKFIFMHHPIFLTSPDEKKDYFNLKSQEELVKLLEKHKVTAVFSGHCHRNAYVKYNDIEYITTSSSGKALGEDPLGFRIIKVYPDHIEHEYFAYENMPEKVGL